MAVGSTSTFCRQCFGNDGKIISGSAQVPHRCNWKVFGFGILFILQVEGIAVGAR